MKIANAKLVGLKSKAVSVLLEHTCTTLRRKRPLEHTCTCATYLYSSFTFLTDHLDSITMHNVHYLLALMDSARQAILEDRYPQFLKEFFRNLYGEKSNIPQWAVTALRGVGVDLMG